jgi:hypothetical protein
MRSLAAHLGDPATHDRLPFHPACPICRQTRLTGQLPAGDLLPPRAKAVMAAGVLAVSSTGPAAVAVAAEQDQQRDGTAVVTQTTTDPADNPDFDPGGDATDLPKIAPPVPQTPAPADPGNDDTAAVDQPTTTNPDDPVVDTGDGSDPTPTSPTTAQPPPNDTPTAPTTAPTMAPTPAPLTTDTASAPTATTAPAEVAPSPSPAPRAARRGSHSSRVSRRAHKLVKATAPQSPSPSSAPAAPAAVTVPAPPAATAVPVRAPGRHAEPGDHVHTVLPGESLWTIATDLLGRNATTANVAREVHRLWQLNSDRIGTGDPDLLMVGTRLDLR